MHPRPAALLLDALGTLVRLEPPGPRLRAELAARFGAEVTEAQAGRAIAAEIAYYRARLDEGRDLETLADLRHRCAQVVREALPVGVVPASVSPEEMTEALLASLRFRAFDEVGPALHWWREAGARLVVVSNWDASLGLVLEDIGLAPLLDGVLTSAQVGARKPAPEIFTRALALAGVSADRAVHVGDSVAEDVAGARSAGIEPVLVIRDGAAAPAGPAGVRTVAGLAELAGLWP